MNWPTIEGELSALAAKYGSDKYGPHQYTRHYEAYFARFKHRPINMLEIGVGGYEDPAQGGSSLRMWNDYFPAARIVALDLHPKTFHVSDRVSIIQGSQTDAALLARMSDEAGGFDIVVDDGSHINEHVITTFNILFPRLKQGGLYVVEDAQTSYWPVLGGSSENPDSASTMMGFFKSLIHGINHAEFLQGARPAGRFDSDILGIAFYQGMIFVEKGDNSWPSNVSHDSPLRRNTR